MKFALINGVRQEPQPNLVAQCTVCGADVVSRCGEVRVWHWAHKATRNCDSWWEGETEWHRSWKDQFPAEWQEVVHQSESGEKHIADIRTQNGWVIEFQHSYINPDERRSREEFYKRLIWVVDGSRRVRDASRFMKVVEQSSYNNLWPELRVTFAEGAIFRDWITSRCHVIYDFGGGTLWCLFPQSNELWAYILPISRMELIESLKSNNLSSFDDLVRKFRLFLESYKSPRHLVQGIY